MSAFGPLLLLWTSYAPAECDNWVARGECTANPAFMTQNCAEQCEKVLECHVHIAKDHQVCRTKAFLQRCNQACFDHFQNHVFTEDKMQNCWYWTTDRECTLNPTFMQNSCKRSCDKLQACTEDSASDKCALPFMCAPEADKNADCVERAARGECRPSGDKKSAVFDCSFSCHMLDAVSVSRAVTRPVVRLSARIDEPIIRHAPGHCKIGNERIRSAMEDKSRNVRRENWPWSPWRPTCVLSRQPFTARTGRHGKEPPSEAQRLSADGSSNDGVWVYGLKVPADGDSDVFVQTISESPRVRLLHNFVTADEAQTLQIIANHHYYRSSTARSGSDKSRTSYSAMLAPSQSPVVSVIRQRISAFSGYPEAVLEPLQEVKYEVGQYYKPHNDYYNECETWVPGNRHFTFLIYLNEVEGGGETGFPKLNLTITPVRYAALVFNNVLENGAPDERTQHEGLPPTSGVKQAINGWMRVRTGFSRRPR